MIKRVAVFVAIIFFVLTLYFGFSIIRSKQTNEILLEESEPSISYSGILYNQDIDEILNIYARHIEFDDGCYRINTENPSYFYLYIIKENNHESSGNFNLVLNSQRSHRATDDDKNSMYFDFMFILDESEDTNTSHNRIMKEVYSPYPDEIIYRVFIDDTEQIITDIYNND